MSFTYTGSVATDLEQVRLLIGDTNAATALFQDAEIDWFLAQHGTVHLAAAAAARAVAANKNKLAQRLSEGDYSRDLGRHGQAVARPGRPVGWWFSPVSTPRGTGAARGLS